MSPGKPLSKVRQAYTFIEAHRNEFSIQAMCRVLGVPVLGTTPGLIILFLIGHRKMHDFCA
jgi:hypothetical protein